MKNRYLAACIIGLMLLIAFSGCVEPERTYRSTTRKTYTSTTYSIEYRVTGTAKYADVCYENEDEGTSMQDDVKVGVWKYKFKAKRGQFLYISAQNCGKSGSITVSIYVDGSLYKKSTSSGAYVIATASGSAGRD